jgi:quinoprotein glucose dehydrogenase
MTVDGKRIDGVVQVTKQGFAFVFDRVTGVPVWPIEERPVPTDSNVPGEKVYPTQPFPTRPPAFTPQGVSLEDANDLTPAIKSCVAEMKCGLARSSRRRHSKVLKQPTSTGGAGGVGGI